MKCLTCVAAGESAAGTGGPATFSQAGGDFYTAEEMAQFVKPKKRRLKKKLRKKESEESEAATMASEIAALEVAAAAAGVGDHGSRAGRGAEKAQLEAQERLADLQKRQERCTAYHPHYFPYKTVPAALIRSILMGSPQSFYPLSRRLNRRIYF